MPNEDNKIRIHSIDELTKIKDEHKETEDKGNLGHLVTETEIETNELANEPVKIQDHTN